MDKMKFIVEPHYRRVNLYRPRRRRGINYYALVRPGYYLVMIGLVGFALYTCNSWRASADNAVERWAKQVGVE
jgi:hypothetical protein